MKKSLIALAVLGAFAGAASAQSSVTLSGMLDAGLIRTGTATGYDWAMGGAGSAFNNFTLSGKEDLGGGMNAFFTMNHRFRIQNGTINSANQLDGSTTFYRNIFVGLGGGFGDVRLGRMLMPLQEMNGNFDPWYGGYTVASTHTGGITATIRAQQAIYYRSPSMSGFSLHAAIASSQGQLAAETANNYGSVATGTGAAGERPVGLALNYAAGPLKATLAYDKNYADFKTVGLYGQYDFGVARLNMQFEDGDSTIGGLLATKEKMKAFSIAADIPFGAITGKVGYLIYNSDRNTCTGAGSAVGGTKACDAKKFGFGGEYAFSKRTLVYSDIGKASGDRLSDATRKATFDIGLRHKF
jgi:predicted porin